MSSIHYSLFALEFKSNSTKLITWTHLYIRTFSVAVSSVGRSWFWFSTTCPLSLSVGLGRGLLLSFSEAKNSEVGFSSVTSRLGPLTTRPERVVVVPEAVSKLDSSFVIMDKFSSLIEHRDLASDVFFLGLPLLRFRVLEFSEVSLNCRQRASTSGTPKLVAACCTLCKLSAFKFSSPV